MEPQRRCRKQRQTYRYEAYLDHVAVLTGSGTVEHCVRLLYFHLGNGVPPVLRGIDGKRQISGKGHASGWIRGE